MIAFVQFPWPWVLHPSCGPVSVRPLSSILMVSYMERKIQSDSDSAPLDFYIHGGTTTVYKVLQNWNNILGNATTLSTGFIVLEHDLFEESVEVATGYILPDALAHNPPFSIKPVSDCLKLSLADAYIETNDNKTHPPALPAAISGKIVMTINALCWA